MKKFLSVVGMPLAIALLVSFTIPANATTISFSNVVSGSGDITTSVFGPNAPLSDSLSCTPADAICAMNFATLVISGAPTASANGTYNPVFLSENYNAASRTLTISGSLASLPGLASTSTLVTIVFSSNLTGNATVSSFTLNAPPPISTITINSILAADLGSAGPYALSSMTVTGNPGGAIPNYNSTSGTLVLTTDFVPEPTSAVFVATGLALAGLISRKKFSKTK